LERTEGVPPLFLDSTLKAWAGVKRWRTRNGFRARLRNEAARIVIIAIGRVKIIEEV
jgi:hypothetical protein